MRFFNTAGPCKLDIHYLLPPTDRLPDVQLLIDQQSYFVLHGPRQSGKTMAMLELARQLTAARRYAAVLVSALEQLDGYLSGLGLSTGWLVIFDRRSGQPPISERTIATRGVTPGGREVTIIRG
jgi:hypothetical protein